MRAQVVDRVELAANIAHRDVMVTHVKDRDAFGLNLGRGAHGLPGGHDRSPRIVDQIRSSMDGNCNLERVDWKNPSTISCSAVEWSSPRDCR